MEACKIINPFIKRNKNQKSEALMEKYPVCSKKHVRTKNKKKRIKNSI